MKNSPLGRLRFDYRFERIGTVLRVIGFGSKCSGLQVDSPVYPHKIYAAQYYFVNFIQIKIYPMLNWKFTLVFGLLIIGLSLSCSKNDDDDAGGLCGATWATNINDEIEALSQAAAAYGNTGSKEDCEKYKQALRDYVDEISKYESCYLEAGRIEEFRQSVAESQEDIEKIQC